MHSIEEIKKNQDKFFDDIISYLKKDLKEAKSELSKLNPGSDEIKKLKEKLQKKVNKFKLVPELEKYFISKENQEPNYYAMWDEESQSAQIFKFINNEKRKKGSKNSSN